MSDIEIDRANTILYCFAWVETVEFYRTTLGLRVSFENDWFVEFETGQASHISVADVSRATVASNQGAGITLSWRVPNVDDVREQLEKLGARPTAVHQKWGASAVHVFDPEGHRIELWSD